MSVPLLVFTWNLHGKEEALQSACRYLARRTPCIATFQELPEGGATAIERYSRGLLRQVISLRRRLAIVVSTDVSTMNGQALAPGGFPNVDQRMIEVTLTNTAFESLRFFAVHLPSRRDLSEGQRDAPLSRLAHAFHDAWGGGPAVLAGDFNADPYHREIAARGFFWAVRDRGELTDRRRQILRSELSIDVRHGGKTYPSASDLRGLPTLRDRSPLFNPMWKCLAERREHPRGTHRYLDDHCGISWHCYDQILLSPDLVESVQRLRILTRLGRATLIDAQRKRPTKAYGDHLPVKLELHPSDASDAIQE